MIHIIIAEERRVSTEEKARTLAISINNDLLVSNGKTDARGMPDYDVTSRPAQLHSMGKTITDKASANIIYAAEWDGKAPYVIVLKGDIADLKMAYAGWPMVDQKTWEASNLSDA